MSNPDIKSLELSCDAIVITTADLDPPGPQIVHVNAAFTHMTGYAAEEVLGATPRLLQGPKTDRKALDRLRRLLARGEGAVVETINYKKDGGEIAVEWQVSPIRDPRGRVTHFLSIQRDVSERRRAQDALFTRGERIRATLDALGDAVATTDVEGAVDYLNPVAEMLTGWTVERARGRPLGEVLRLVDGRDRPLDDLALRCLEERRTLELSEACRLTPRTGTVLEVRVAAAPIRPRPDEISGVVTWMKTVKPRRGRTVPAGDEAVPDTAGLVSGKELARRLDQVLRSAKQRGTVHAVCFIELEPPLATLEDAGGEGVPRFRRKLASSLRRAVRSSDTLARVDGGRFGLMLNHCPLDKAMEVAETVLETVRGVSFVGRVRTMPITASIGLVPFTAEARCVEELFERGREACATARALGGGQVQVFRSEPSDTARRRHEVVRAVELLDALEQGRFRLYGQPIVPLGSSSSLPVHYEILLRMLDDNGDLVPPKSFIMAAERFDIMPALDRWVISTVLRRYHEIFNVLPVGISINLSTKSLGDDTMLELIQREIAASPIPSKRICFEITETAAIRDLERARRFMTELKRSGCRFALDDFGSGHSSFTYLKSLPVDFLKIDGSFVRDLLAEPFDRAMVEAIRQMGHGMGIRIVAEWAETEEILDKLGELGIDYAQGYAVGPPEPLESFAVAASA